MEGNQSVSLWEVKLPINGLISIEQDEIGMGDVTFHPCKDGFLAKTVVNGSRDDMIRNEAIKRVNKTLDKIAFEIDAPIRIEESGPIITNRVSKHVEKTTGEVIDSTASITIKLIHPIDEETVSKADKLGSNIRDNAKNTFQRSLSHYRNGLNAEFDRNPKAFLDFCTSIEVIAGHYGEGRCLFSWDNVTENDSEELIRYLIDEFGIKWVKDAEIIKLDNDDSKTIRIFKDENSVEIRIDEKAGKAILITSDFRTRYLKAKNENGKLNIYGNKIKDKIYDCCEKCFGERKEDEVRDLYKIRNSVAHGSKDVSDPEEIKIMIEKTPQIKDLAKRVLNFWSKKIDMTRKSRID